MKKGMVYLVGAGPGDPGLITVKGLECIKKADVVVYDHLLDEDLLKYALAQAERVYAGKQAARHALEQDEINSLLVAKAGEGKLVVRLKGGDPYVLGRGGEEGEALKKANICFEVVPGVTSAVAVPGYAGIPVTHRGIASSFAVITGHEDPSKETSSLDWEHLAKGVDTLVFLMGTQHLTEIASKLIKHGRSSETPVAVVSNGTRPTQRTVTGTLETIGSKVADSRITTPAIIVVGEVVSMRSKLAWFESRPLFGKRVVVTRSRHQASEMSRLLAERGAIPIELPVIEVVASDGKALDSAISRLDGFDWIVFTSINGVDSFFSRLSSLGRDARALGCLEVAAIGPATSQGLTSHGITADIQPKEFTSVGLVAALKGQKVSGKRFLLPRADIADDLLSQGLRSLGAEVEEVEAYRTISPGIGKATDMLASGAIDVVTFASSSSVSNFVAALDGVIELGQARIACIGPKTAETARKLGLKVEIMAKESTIPALVDAIEGFFEGEENDVP